MYVNIVIANAAAVHNIGAFGVEFKDLFYELSAYHLEERKMYTFCLNDCEFGYCDSIFKQRDKENFVVVDVTFRLSKSAQLNIDGVIRQELQRCSHPLDINLFLHWSLDILLE